MGFVAVALASRGELGPAGLGGEGGSRRGIGLSKGVITTGCLGCFRVLEGFSLRTLAAFEFGAWNVDGMG